MICPTCGKICSDFIRGKQRQFCSIPCVRRTPECYAKIASSQKGNKSHQWKGGFMFKNGYKCILNTEHPNNIKGYVLEHRLVMEKHIGRYLNGSEIVHHINGNRSDNRLENLILTTQSWHKTHHQTGFKFSMESRKKMSQSHMGKNPYKNQKQRSTAAKLGWIKRKSNHITPP